MASPEKRRLENIPDMSLPERSDKPAEPRKIPDLALPAQAEQGADPAGIKKPLPPWEKGARAADGWKVGDRVLAPWEPMFLYAGAIREFKTGKALVEFDDGDAGWVFVDQLRPLSVKVGQKVLSRRKMGVPFFAGAVLQVRGDSVLVGFDDGGADEWTRVAALRIICEEEEIGAEPVRFASNQAYYDQLQEGDRVWAPWNADLFFAGTVRAIRDGEVHVHFDDGDQGWVQIEQLMPLVLTVGMRVVSRWQMGPHYFPGTITQVDGEQIYIHYDDGDKEWTRPAALTLPRDPVGPAARPTKTVTHGGGATQWRWLAPVMISVVLLFLRIGCRAMSAN